MSAIRTKQKWRKYVGLLVVVLLIFSSAKAIFWLSKPALANDIYLQMNEGYGTSSAVNDSNGKISPGSITGAVWRQSDLCKNDKCLYFDGSGDKVTFSDDVDLDFTATNTFTISGWFRHAVIATNPDYLVTKHQNSTAGGYKVYMDSDGDLVFGVDDDGTWNTTDIVGDDQSKNFDDNKWHFFTAVKDGTAGIYLYVDGVLIDQDTSLAETGSLANAASFYVGIDADGTSNAWDGFVDEVKVSRAAKTNTEIITDYLGSSTLGTGNGPVAHWRLDENTGTTAYDATGNGNTGTLTNSPTWTTGKFGSGVSFSDATSNRYINVSSATSIDSLPQMTWSSWVYFTTVSATQTIMAKGGNLQFVVYDAGGVYRPRFYVEHSGGYLEVSLTSTANLSANRWYHLAVTWDGTTSHSNAHIYINGVDQVHEGSVNGAGTPSGDTGSALTIGANWAAANQVKGVIDDVKVYNYPRSNIQIFEDMVANAPSGASVLFGASKSYLSNGLVGYWKMDENTGTTVTDLSGNGNTGAFNNTPAWATGKYGSGVYFDTATTNKYISVPAATSINNLSAFTISTWVNPAELADNTQIFNKGGAMNLYFENISSSMRTQFGMACSGDDLAVLATSTDAMSLNTWHHVVVTWDGLSCAMNSVNVYIDGKLIAKHANSVDGTGTRSSDSGNNLIIGNDVLNLTVSQIQGSVDETRLYNRAFSADEVSQLYNWAPGPMGDWKMDENSGTTAYDSSGNGYNAAFQDSLTARDWTTGKFGSAVSFIGTNKSAQVNNTTAFDFGSATQFTVGAWFKIPADTGTQQTLFAPTDLVSAGFEIYTGSDGRIRAAIGSGTYCSIRNTSTSLEDNQWHYVEVVFNRGSGCTVANTFIYIDGKKEPTVVSDSSGNADAVIDTGGVKFTTTSSNDGIILDSIKIYNYARTPSQILEDMNGAHSAPGGSVGSTVARWGFDETSLNRCSNGTDDYCDSSINRNDLAFSTTTGGFASSGKFGSAFDGTGSVWATRADDDDFDFSASEDMSISMWFKSDSATNPGASTNQYLLAKGTITNTGTAGYVVYADSSGFINFGVKDDAAWGASSPGSVSPDDVVTSTADVYDATWHHFVGVKSGTNRMDLYVDGKLIASDISIAATATLANSIALRFADDDADATNSFAGDIDELQIFRGALTKDQVLTLYNSGNQTVLGSASTDSSGVPSNSLADSYCPPGQGSACTPPILHWKMDENAGSTSTNDSSTNGYTGTLIGSMTSSDWVPGKLGSGLRFDGVDDSIQNTSISPPTGDFTYSIWIYPTALATSNPFIGLAQATIGGVEFNVDTDTDGDIDVLLDNEALLINGTNGLITTNRWHHITITRIGSTVTSYINGKADVTGTDGDALSLAPCGIRVGRSQASTTCSSGGSDKFQGYLDDFRVYNYGRTPAQVAWDYNRGAPVGWWKLDEANGLLANDSMINSTAGTLTNSPAWTTGKLNSGVAFAGSNQQILIADDSDFDFADDESMTVAVWFKHNTAAAQEIIVSKYAAAGYKIIMESDGDITCGLDYDATWTPTDSITSTLASYDDNNWHHVACVKDGATSLSLYIDGVLIGSDSSLTATNTLTNADPVYLGIDADGTSNDFTGTLDDIRIYRYPLNGTQIKSVMSDGSVKIGQ